MRSLLRGIPAVAFLLLVGCASAFDVYRVQKPCDGCSKTFGKEALFYALPQTIVTVDAVVDKRVVTDGACKGELALLGADAEALVSRSKLGAVAIGSRAEPDPTQIFAIKLSHKWYQKLTSSFSLSETGLLTAAELAVENQAVDFAVTTLKTAVGLAVKTGTFGGKVPNALTKTDCQKKKDEIDRLRGIRAKLTEGTQTPNFPPDGAALALMLDKLTEREKALVADFIGSAELTTGTVHCEVSPDDSDGESTKDLFKLAEDGVIAIGTCRVPSELVAVKATKSLVSAVFVTKPNNQLAGIASAASGGRTDDPSGLVYRIPATTNIEIRNGTTPVAFERRLVAQFGTIATLPRTADVSTFQSSVKAALYSGTGAMQKLDLAGTPQGTGAITGVADAAGTILDARAAARKAEAAASDELAQLERQRKILEEKKKIIELGGTPGKSDNQP